ncbi:MAG: cobalamin B12-binding domain-containing protein [Actinobacteria bacterium]|nr:cobalamin B12-binding domain-containing protein [Actinomycetota bacterium]
MEELLATLRDSLIGSRRDAALAVTARLLEEGAPPETILQEGLAAAMIELGARWTRGEVYLPEVVAAATLFERCNDLLEPALLSSGVERTGGRVVLATVKGDLHDLGKNMVGAMLKTVGFEVHDIGKNAPVDTIVAAVGEVRPEILGLSALLTTTVPEQRRVIEALAEAGLRDSVKVMVGGAPVTETWAAEIGADGFAPDAPRAVQVALAITGR